MQRAVYVPSDVTDWDAILRLQAHDQITRRLATFSGVFGAVIAKMMDVAQMEPRLSLMMPVRRVAEPVQCMASSVQNAQSGDAQVVKRVMQ